MKDRIIEEIYNLQISGSSSKELQKGIVIGVVNTYLALGKITGKDVLDIWEVFNESES